jgi:hypothetical protein
MPKGQSGRVVIEIDPALKRRLYSALAAESITLKAWFIETAHNFLQDREQPRLPLNSNRKGRKRP